MELFPEGAGIELTVAIAGAAWAGVDVPQLSASLKHGANVQGHSANLMVYAAMYLLAATLWLA